MYLGIYIIKLQSQKGYENLLLIFGSRFGYIYNLVYNTVKIFSEISDVNIKFLILNGLFLFSFLFQPMIQHAMDFRYKVRFMNLLTVAPCKNCVVQNPDKLKLKENFSSKKETKNHSTLANFKEFSSSWMVRIYFSILNSHNFQKS